MIAADLTERDGMARTAKDGLSRHPEKGFRITIGKKADGKPRLFWLGQHRATAEYHADALKGQFSHMKAADRDVWTPEDEERVRWYVGQFKESMRLLRARQEADLRQLDEARISLEQKGRMLDAILGDFLVPAVKPALVAAPPKATLYSAIKAYVAAIKHKPMSDKHKERAVQVVEANLKRVRTDCPLTDVDFAWLDSLCDFYKSRPKNLKDGKQMKPAGVANVLRYLRLFFVWLDDTEFGGWQAPRKLHKPFKVRVADLMTSMEHREASTIEQFDVPTLVKLYQAGTNRQKAIMLASLFTGGTQQELAVLEKLEFDLDAGTLHHFRNKTAVEGRFWLPPELVALLKADFAKRPGDPLAFRTEDGNALVTFKDGRQTSDAVRQAWDDLRENAEVPDTLSFKYLRKFLGNWMKRNGGESIGQVALSQRPNTVLSKHYTSARDFEQFNELQRKMHAELKAAGMFDVSNVRKMPKANKATERTAEQAESLELAAV
jgi:hypothetical protein